MTTITSNNYPSDQSYDLINQDEIARESQGAQDIFNREMDELVMRFEKLYISNPKDPVDLSPPL